MAHVPTLCHVRFFFRVRNRFRIRENTWCTWEFYFRTQPTSCRRPKSCDAHLHPSAPSQLFACSGTRRMFWWEPMDTPCCTDLWPHLSFKSNTPWLNTEVAGESTQVNDSSTPFKGNAKHNIIYGRHLASSSIVVDSCAVLTLQNPTLCKPNFSFKAASC